MEPTILRSQVFKEIHSGEPFDMIWITADRRRGTGGDLITAESWMILSRDAEPMLQKDDMRSGVLATGNQQPETSKDPNHQDNGTVNIFNPANSGIHPITVHWDLIQFFNGKRVIN